MDEFENVSKIKCSKLPNSSELVCLVSAIKDGREIRLPEIKLNSANLLLAAGGLRLRQEIDAYDNSLELEYADNNGKTNLLVTHYLEGSRDEKKIAAEPGHAEITTRNMLGGARLL